MKRSRAWIVALMCALLVLSGCSKASKEADTYDTATLENVSGSPLKRVTLSNDAVRRIGLETVTVGEQAGSPSRRTVPYAALLYDPEGTTWVFTRVGENVFLRSRIVIDRIIGDTVIVSEGPASGSIIVTTGAAELYGAESTFGED